MTGGDVRAEGRVTKQHHDRLMRHHSVPDGGYAGVYVLVSKSECLHLR